MTNHFCVFICMHVTEMHAALGKNKQDALSKEISAAMTVACPVGIGALARLAVNYLWQLQQRTMSHGKCTAKHLCSFQFIHIREYSIFILTMKSNYFINFTLVLICLHLLLTRSQFFQPCNTQVG